MFKKIKVNDYNKALELLYKTIPKVDSKKFPGEVGLARQKLLLKYLGNPQNKIKVIHIAGTSGKGSVTNYLSRLLVKHGFKVGLTVSPHLMDIRERIQVDNKLIRKDEFSFLVEKVLNCFEKVEKKGLGSPTYFEVLIAMSFLYFYESKVDYAVIETGMGGTFDGTNSISSENKISVISRLGLDHTKILGKTITEIAKQKSGIIQKKNEVLSLWQGNKIDSIIKKAVFIKKGHLNYIEKGKNFSNIKSKENGFVYDFSFKDLLIRNLYLKSLAVYQIENSALALGVFKIISDKNHFRIDEEKVREVFLKYFFRGRMDFLKRSYKGIKKEIILDGAHNPQKMSNFLESLKRFDNRKKTFLIAFKEGKDFSKMLRSIIKKADKIILTSFEIRSQDMIQRSLESKKMAIFLDRNNFSNYKVIENLDLAIKEVLKSKDLTIITGSLYLLSNVYPLLDKYLEK